MTITVRNTSAKTELAARTRKVNDLTEAHNLARELSKDFHGTFAIEQDQQIVGYYVDGRKYKDLTTMRRQSFGAE